MTPGDLTYRNQLVRITDLAVTSDTIEGVTFEGCQIVGPAVIALLHSNMIRSTIDGNVDAVIWPIATSRQWVIGGIALVNCTVANCRLERIGLAVPEAEVEQVRRSLGAS